MNHSNVILAVRLFDCHILFDTDTRRFGLSVDERCFVVLLRLDYFSDELVAKIVDPLCALPLLLKMPLLRGLAHGLRFFLLYWQRNEPKCFVVGVLIVLYLLRQIGRHALFKHLPVLFILVETLD